MCSNTIMASTIWKGHLTFGLVSIPIKLTRAARAEKVHMHNLQRKTGGRVRQVFVPAEEPPASQEEPVPPRKGVLEMGPSLVAARTQVAPYPAERNLPAEVEERPFDQGIPRSELVRGFEYQKGKYVEFEPEELDKIAPKTSDSMEIVEFVRFAEVDAVYL